jgi:hypothetical protein
MSTDHKQPVFTYENAKTVKGEDLGYLTAIRYLAPAGESIAAGGANVCPNAGECAKVCLYTAGRGAFGQVKAARIRKTLWRLRDRKGHLDAASSEIAAAVARAARTGKTLAVRMNGTSDLSADSVDLARKHPHVQFYDYTKNVGVMKAYLRGELPTNYHLTLSYDPSTVDMGKVGECVAVAVENGTTFGVAVCFNTRRGQDLPHVWKGAEVLDGDTHDLRFLDKASGAWFIVGLRAKGAAKKPALSTFTVEV